MKRITIALLCSIPAAKKIPAPDVLLRMISKRCWIIFLLGFMLSNNPAAARHSLVHEWVPAAVQDSLPSYVLNGLVQDENKNPLPNASVQIRGTVRTAQTNLDGKFIIEARRGDSLVVSSVGYLQQTLLLQGNPTILIQLLPDIEGQKLNEVQVVGYGSQKKTTMVGAVSTVSVAEIQKYSTPQLTNAIGGKLAGVLTRQTSGEPGYDAAKIYVRGLVSQSGVNKPLIIVDGVERELNDYWTNMNIQDIESFSVLKDASATAVYGNRGANGVILIVTKKGVVGKTRVIFRTETAVATPQRIEDNINAYEYASLVNESRRNIGETVKYSDAELQKFKDHSDPYLYPDVDWYRTIFRKNTMQTINNLGITGGTEIARYYVNLGYTLQQGMYVEDPDVEYKTNAMMHQYNFRSRVDVKLNKRLSIDLGLAGISKAANFPGRARSTIFDVLKLTNPLMYPVKNPDGSNPGASGDSKINPYTLVTQTGYTKQFYNTITSNLNVRWDMGGLLPGLSLNGLAAFDVVDITQNVRTKDPATFYYKKDPITGAESYTPIVTETALGLYNLNENYRTVYEELRLDYVRSVGKHNITALLAANRRQYNNVNAGNSIDNIPERRQGLIGRITYNYDTRYLLEVNAGYTGSEQFPKGKRYGLFPSIGPGWIVSNEKFWHFDFIDLLKFRGSYGLVGNDRIGGERFLFQTRFDKNAPGYVFGQDQNINPGGKRENFIGNPDVTWEHAYKTNIGLDVEMLQHMITLTADLFHERREDQLLRRQIIPIYAGYPGFIIPYGNVGIVENKGIDGSFQFRNTTKGGLYYSVNGNLTFAKNKIIENDYPKPQYPWQDLRGYPIGANLGYIAEGFFKDEADITNSPDQTYFQSVIRPGDVKYKDINGDNKITNADQTVIGKYGSEPQMMYGLGIVLSYKGFDASVFFTGAARRDFFFTQQWTAMPFASGESMYNVMQMVYDQRWIPGADNSGAKFPAVRSLSKNNYVGSTIYLRSGDYLRVKNAEIGYNFPDPLMKRWKLNGARLFVQGTNLATWDHIKAIDPESDFGTGSYPISRNFNFGLEVRF